MCEDASKIPLSEFADTRIIRKSHLFLNVKEASCLTAEKKQTYMLIRYTELLTSKSDRCKWRAVVWTHYFKNHWNQPELLLKIDEWLNGTVAGSTGFFPLELTLKSPRDLFKKFLKKCADQVPPDESLFEQVLKSYIRKKSKVSRRLRVEKGVYASGNHRQVI